jgi:hypothetical protein
MEHERDAPLLGTLQDPAPPPPQKLPSRLPFYVLATLVVDLQAYLIGFTVSFSGPTIRSIKHFRSAREALDRLGVKDAT